MNQSQRAKDFCKGQTDAQFAYIEAEREINHLKDENTKLRELCEYLWEFAKTCGADHPFLRELGIEVDE